MNPTDTSTDALVESYLTNAELLSAVVRDGGDWSAPSPCAGWSAADVLDHLVTTQRDFLTRQGIDLGPAPEGDPAARWTAHLDAVRRVLADRYLVSTEYDGFFGRTTIAATLANFYGFDLLVHRWDLARALGRDVRWTDAELDTIDRSLDGFGEHLYDDGICAPALSVDDDAPRQERSLARMGRRA